VCRGSRTNKECVSAICWCCVKIWIRTAVTNTVVLLVNNVNGIKKHLEDVLVDAPLGCKFCSVGVIFSTSYNTNNSEYSKLSLSPRSQFRYQLVCQVKLLMHII
jgi:hypothetical protein